MLLSLIVVISLLITLGRTSVIREEEAANDTSQSDNIRYLLKAIAERLDRWDSFYMGRLETHIISAATSLANLDTNIKNLQERAHVWDTFQLHVAAWNDQIKSLDHKVNIINQGYEKLLSLDAQLNLALHPNGTLPAMLTKLAAMEARLDNLAHGISRDPMPVFGDFVARGLLHTVRQLERKMDRMQTTIDRVVHSRRLNEEKSHEVIREIKESEEREDLTNGKMAVPCTIPPVLEGMLRDVSAKVDSIFDKNEEEFNVDSRHSNVACKRLLGPYKKLANSVEYVKTVVQDLVEEPIQHEETSPLRMSRRLPIFSDIKKSLEDIEDSIKQLGRQQGRNINENEHILHRLERKVNAITNDDDLEEYIRTKLNSIEKKLTKIDHDDSDEEKSKNKSDDESSDDDNDNDTKGKKLSRKGKNRNDDDDDSSDDVTKGRKSNKRGKEDNWGDEEDDDDDDDDDDDNDNDNNSSGDGGNDDDDDDDNDNKNGRKDKKNNRDDNDDSDNDNE